ncbi:MAG TPA: hypothetical protein VF585_03045 [Chthoniobacterales bacterium]|jgi:hypothetical protein
MENEPNEAIMTEEALWVAHGSEAGELHEDFLIGSRAGLEALRSAIEEALRSGEGPISHPGIEYIGVRLIEVDPRLSIPKRPIKEALFAGGCILASLFIGFLLILGFRALPSLF